MEDLQMNMNTHNVVSVEATKTYQLEKCGTFVRTLIVKAKDHTFELQLFADNSNDLVIKSDI